MNIFKIYKKSYIIIIIIIKIIMNEFNKKRNTNVNDYYSNNKNISKNKINTFN